MYNPLSLGHLSSRDIAAWQLNAHEAVIWLLLPTAIGPSITLTESNLPCRRRRLGRMHADKERGDHTQRLGRHRRYRSASCLQTLYRLCGLLHGFLRYLLIPGPCEEAQQGGKWPPSMCEFASLYLCMLFCVWLWAYCFDNASAFHFPNYMPNICCNLGKQKRGGR